MSIRAMVRRLGRSRPRFAPSQASMRALWYETTLAEVNQEIADREEQALFYERRRERAHTMFPHDEPPVSEQEEALYEMLDNLRMERNLLESLEGLADRVSDAEGQYRRAGE